MPPTPQNIQNPNPQAPGWFLDQLKEYGSLASSVVSTTTTIGTPLVKVCVKGCQWIMSKHRAKKRRRASVERPIHKEGTPEGEVAQAIPSTILIAGSLVTSAAGLPTIVLPPSIGGKRKLKVSWNYIDEDISDRGDDDADGEGDSEEPPPKRVKKTQEPKEQPKISDPTALDSSPPAASASLPGSSPSPFNLLQALNNRRRHEEIPALETSSRRRNKGTITIRW